MFSEKWVQPIDDCSRSMKLLKILVDDWVPVNRVLRYPITALLVARSRCSLHWNNSWAAMNVANKALRGGLQISLSKRIPLVYIQWPLQISGWVTNVVRWSSNDQLWNSSQLSHYRFLFPLTLWRLAHFAKLHELLNVPSIKTSYINAHYVICNVCYVYGSQSRVCHWEWKPTTGGRPPFLADISHS